MCVYVYIYIYIYVYIYHRELATYCGFVFQCWVNNPKYVASSPFLLVQRWSKHPQHAASFTWMSALAPEAEAMIVFTSGRSLYIYVYIYMYIYACMYVYIYIYMYIHIEREGSDYIFTNYTFKVRGFLWKYSWWDYSRIPIYVTNYSQSSFSWWNYSRIPIYVTNYSQSSFRIAPPEVTWSAWQWVLITYFSLKPYMFYTTMLQYSGLYDICYMIYAICYVYIYIYI